MILRFVLFVSVICIYTTVAEKLPIKPKILHSEYFTNANITNDVQGAVVLKSNMPVQVQNQLAAALTTIYQGTSDPMQRLQQFQTAVTRLYAMYWNVVSNFSYITFYNQYFIYLQINSDQVLAFGLS